jgi:gas vesicle protein
MADYNDRYDSEGGGAGFMMGLLTGTVLGAGLGMLFAPRPGSELRTQLTDQASKLRNTAGGAYSQVGERVTQIVDRGREAYDRARTSTESGNMGAGSSGAPGSSSTGATGTGGSMAGSSTYTGAGTNDRG